MITDAVSIHCLKTLLRVTRRHQRGDRSHPEARMAVVCSVSGPQWTAVQGRADAGPVSLNTPDADALGAPDSSPRQLTARGPQT